MFGHMNDFSSSTNPQRDRRIHRPRPEDLVRFKWTGEPGRWPTLRRK